MTYKPESMKQDPQSKAALDRARERFAGGGKVMPNLWPVINWLENGCDPKEAAKELRIYEASRGQDHSEQHLNMVQGEWVDLTDDDIEDVINSSENYNLLVDIRAVIAKFKEKNTPNVVPDGYALISIDALKAWGKHEEVSNACCYPIHEPVVQQGEPVAVHQWRKRQKDAPWHDAPHEFAYARVDDFYEARTLYTTPPSVEAAIEATKEKAIRIAVTFGDTGRVIAGAIKGMI